MPRKSEFPNELISLCRERWLDGGSWGAATSNAIVTEQWLPREVTDSLHQAVREKYTEVEAALKAGKNEVREIGKKFCEAFEVSFRTGNHHSESAFYSLPEEYVPSYSLLTGQRVCPEIHLLCLEIDHASWRRKNGVDRVSLLPLEKVVLAFDQNYDECDDYASFRASVRYTIVYDEIKQLYRLRAFRRVNTDPIPESMRRRNWCRSKKQNEFLSKCREMFRKLNADGWKYDRIQEIKYSSPMIVFVKNEQPSTI